MDETARQSSYEVNRLETDTPDQLTSHELFDVVVGNSKPVDWMRAAHELEDRADERDRLRDLIVEWHRSGEEFEIPCSEGVTKRHVTATNKLKYEAQRLVSEGWDADE